VRRANTSGTTYSGARRLEGRAGARVAAAHERERNVELLAAHVHLALQGRKVATRDELEVPVGEGARGGEPRRCGVELSELQLDALGHGAGADAGGIELLDDREHPLDARGVGAHFAGHRLGDRRGGFREVAVVVDGVDDRAPDSERVCRQVGELELPGKVVAQRPSRFVGKLELRVAGSPTRAPPTPRRSARPTRR
jgi:hypothetical protein